MKKRDLLIAIIVVLLDQITKYVVFAYDRLNIEVIKDFFYIGQVKNTGAAWGVFSGNMLLFYIVTVVALYFIVDLYRKSYDRPFYLRASLMLILGGTIGNFIDRLVFSYVRDFFDFYIFGYDFPLFNIADAALVCGVILVIFYVIKNPHEELIWEK